MKVNLYSTRNDGVPPLHYNRPLAAHSKNKKSGQIDDTTQRALAF